MKRHIQDFRGFSINEGFGQEPEWASDADLLELGIEILELRGDDEPESDAEIMGIAKRLLQEAAPIGLNGNGERDVFAFANWLEERLMDLGIDLSQEGLRISHDAFENQVFIPIQGRNHLGVVFGLDYSELVYQSGGRGIRVPFSFQSDSRGEEITVHNPGDERSLMRAAVAFKDSHGI